MGMERITGWEAWQTGIVASTVVPVALGACAASARAECLWCAEIALRFRCAAAPDGSTGRTGCQEQNGGLDPCRMSGDSCMGGGGSGDCGLPVCGPFNDLGPERGTDHRESAEHREESCPYLGYCPASSAEWF